MSTTGIEYVKYDLHERISELEDELIELTEKQEDKEKEAMLYEARLIYQKLYALLDAIV